MSQHNWMYQNVAWKRRRAHQLRTEPLCRLCSAAGKVTAANVADHIQPHKGDPTKFQGELQSLCTTCHNGAKAAYEASGVMRGCDCDGNPINGWLQPPKLNQSNC